MAPELPEEGSHECSLAVTGVGQDSSPGHAGPSTLLSSTQDTPLSIFCQGGEHEGGYYFSIFTMYGPCNL